MTSDLYKNRYPIYILSKGRWKSRYTVKVLEWMGCDYKVAIEEQEYEKYNKYIPSSKLIIIPEEYFYKYDTCDRYGHDTDLPTGVAPARNFIWDYSVEQGDTRHWIIDDNIRYFYRLNHNRIFIMKSPAFFRYMEDFVLRYNNIALAGPNYENFVERKKKIKPIRWNTRIYSCILIRNDIPYRWRCRFNDDTDLSIRVLKDGWSTVLFNAFSQGKIGTMRLKGGLKEDYDRIGRELPTDILVQTHPDVCRKVWKYNRWHHQCDYTRFKGNNPCKKSPEEIKQIDVTPPLKLDKYYGVFPSKSYPSPGVSK